MDELAGEVTKKGLLYQYQKELEGVKKDSFALEGKFSEAVSRERELAKIRQKLEENNAVSLEMPAPRLATDYYTDKEMFKNPKQKKRAIRIVDNDQILPDGRLPDPDDDLEDLVIDQTEEFCRGLGEVGSHELGETVELLDCEKSLDSERMKSAVEWSKMEEREEKVKEKEIVQMLNEGGRDGEESEKKELAINGSVALSSRLPSSDLSPPMLQSGPNGDADKEEGGKRGEGGVGRRSKVRSSMRDVPKEEEQVSEEFRKLMKEIEKQERAEEDQVFDFSDLDQDQDTNPGTPRTQPITGNREESTPNKVTWVSPHVKMTPVKYNTPSKATAKRNILHNIVSLIKESQPDIDLASMSPSSDIQVHDPHGSLQISPIR